MRKYGILLLIICIILGYWSQHGGDPGAINAAVGVGLVAILIVIFGGE